MLLLRNPLVGHLGVSRVLVKKLDSWLIVPQPHLGASGLLILLVAASLITPLSLDMYTPAVPHMTDYFDTDASTVNLTLVGYYLFFSIGLLIFGPISDKHGRRSVLVGGMAVYLVGSALCAMAMSIWALIAFRVVQALGAGAVSAVSTAVVKDAFCAERREAVLSVAQVMFVVGPVLAPVIGASIVRVADWRVTFWVLAAVSAVCLVMSVLFKETLPKDKRYQGNLLGSLRNLGKVAKNKGFTSFLLIVGMYNLPFMAYIAVASYVYIDFFGLSEMGYSMYFALAALLSAVGPLIWLVAQKFMSARTFTSLILAIAGISGVAMLCVGQISPTLFCITFLVFALMESCARPYSTNILLSQQEDDTGAAASLINFLHTALGSVGMVVAVLPWTNYVEGVGVIIVASMIAAALAWLVLLRSSVPLKGLK